MPVPTALSTPTLATCDRGEVRLCRCCGRVALRFNDVGLTMGRDEMGRMRQTLDAVCEAAERPGAVWDWALRAATSGQQVVFELWGDDTAVLADLLGQAEAVLELDDLLLRTLGPRPAS